MHRIKNRTCLNEKDKAVIAKHINSWQCFTRDMVSGLQVEEWIFSKANFEIQNLFDPNETETHENIGTTGEQEKMDNYHSMEKLIVLWNQYCLIHRKNSFSRGEIRRWLEDAIL